MKSKTKILLWVGGIIVFLYLTGILTEMTNIFKSWW